MKPQMTHMKKFFFAVLFVVFSLPSISQTKVINAGWQFTLDSTKTTWQTVNIPHTWNNEDAFDDDGGYYRGIGWYRKQLFLAKEKESLIHYLKFNGVNQETDVYINGRFIGNHKGGYTAFSFNITDYLKFDDYNLIEVRVNNSHDTNIPPLDADFTFFGGMYRNVELHSLPKQHLSRSDFASDGFYVDYDLVTDELGRVRVTTIIDNFDKKTTSTTLNLSLVDAKGIVLETKTQKISVKSHSTQTISTKFSDIKNPNLWSPETPYLYKLRLELINDRGVILDQTSSNIAFRWVSVDPDKGFFLNGKPYKMIGVNRHQDYEGYGNAVPLSLQENDLHLIKDMGANVLRFAHYPQSRELYKRCDELGILVWSEIPIVNKVTNTPAFFDTSLRMQEAHLKQYYNFPSVVMFGYMNEIFLRLAFDSKSTETEKTEAKVYSYELAKQLEDLTRKIAPNRLTVMALHFNEVYNETKIADLSMLIGWNLYFGWYNGTIPDLGEFLDDQHERFPNRSVMISEYGPGADVHVSSSTPKKYDYTQEYQLILHKSYYEQVMARDFVAGMTAWNFADFSSEFRGETIPHINQKGLVQHNREPKDVYFWYKSILTDAPFVHIAINEQQPLNMIDEAVRSISVFSNQKEGSWTLNGASQQTIQFVNGWSEILVPFKNGQNTLKVIAGSKESIKTISVQKFDDFKTAEIDRLGINLGAHVRFYDEENNITFEPDRAYSANLFGYIDGIAYNMTEDRNQGIPNNIKNTTKDALFQTLREGLSEYRVDLPNGAYNVTLYFVEPKIASIMEMIYNLTSQEEPSVDVKNQRNFDILLNDTLVESNFDLSKRYPTMYGVTVETLMNINNNEGLRIQLKEREGTPVMSGILIEKIK